MSKEDVKDKKPKRKYRHILMDNELYLLLWKVVKKRFDVPHRKLHIVVNEAIREYIERHYPEFLEGD